MTVTPAALAATAAAAARAIEGVARLDAGPVGSLVTYGGGQRIAGVRVRGGEDPAVHVHVVVTLDRPIPLVAEDVHRAVTRALQALGDTGLAVRVHVTDIDQGGAEAIDQGGAEAIDQGGAEAIDQGGAEAPEPRP